MNIANLFNSAQSVLVLLAGLITLAEDPSAAGADKKAAVLSALGPALNVLPVSPVIKTAVTALAPVAVDLLVAKANQAGVLPSSSVEPSSTMP